MDVRPAPEPDEVSLPYWQAAREGVLVVQTCRSCRTGQFPPDIVCHRCLGCDLTFEAVSGEGRVYSYAVFTRSFDAPFPAPYVLALIDLDDRPEVRLMTNIVDTPLDAITVNMPVEVTFEERGEWRLPQFRAKEVAA